jgi:speckle-type POZ protein
VQEAALRDIDLSADEVPVIRAMIRYLYTDDYDDGDPGPATAGLSPDCASCQNSRPCTLHPPEIDFAFPLIFNVKMYVIGDKYDIPGLRALATKKYQACVAVHWNNTTFSESAQHLWDNTMDTDRQLRDVVVKTAHKHIKQFLDRGEFKDFMRSHGDVGLEVVQIMERYSDDRPAECIPVEESVVEESVVEELVVDGFGWGTTSKKKKGRAW